MQAQSFPNLGHLVLGQRIPLDHPSDGDGVIRNEQKFVHGQWVSDITWLRWKILHLFDSRREGVRFEDSCRRSAYILYRPPKPRYLVLRGSAQAIGQFRFDENPSPLAAHDGLGAQQGGFGTLADRPRLAPHAASLTAQNLQGAQGNEDSDDPCHEQANIRKVLRRKQAVEIALRVILGPIALFGGCLLAYRIDDRGGKRVRKFLLYCLSFLLIGAGLGAFCAPIYWQTCQQQSEYSQTDSTLWRKCITEASMISLK